MEKLLQELVAAGLRAKEARVYLAMLELGVTSANMIAKRSSIPRSTVYAVLDALETKGLILRFSKDGDQKFQVLDPEKLQTFLVRQEKALEGRKRVVERLIPKLSVFHNTGRKPAIRYFEGIDGLRRMQREYESYDEDLIQLVGYDTYQLLHDPNTTFEHQEELAKKKRRVRAIVVTDKQVSFSDFDLEFVTISPDVVTVEGEMTVCGDRLVLFSYTKGIVAIEITSPVIAQTARTALELAWRTANNL